MITIMARVGIPIGRWNFDPSLPDAYKCIINVFLSSYDCIPSSLEREIRKAVVVVHSSNNNNS